MKKETPLNSSPSRTYVMPVFVNDSTEIYFRKFTLPEKDEHPAKNMILSDNSCDTATWWFYNIIDGESCGKSAYPIEMHFNIKE